MNRVEFRLTMPNSGSWNGQWSGAGRRYLIFKNLTNKTITRLGIEPQKPNSWFHSWNDGWGACVTARIMEPREKKNKSDGFYGYDWMVDNIMCYGDTRKPEKQTEAA